MSRAWDEVPLSDLCDLVQYGYTASASSDPVGPKFLRITDIVPENLSWSGVPYCEIDPGKQEKYMLATGDIVVARTGATVGYAKYLQNPPPAVFASYLVRFRVSDAHDSRYVGSVVESDSYKAFIKSHAGGAAQPNANAKVLASFPVPIPPLSVQRKITAVLAPYDELIESNLRRIEILEEMAQTVYREWFVNFRFPGHEDVELVDSTLGPIPLGWEVTPFSDLADFINGFAFKPAHLGESGMPIVKIKELKNGVTVQTPRNDGSAIPSKFHIEAGDLLFSWSAALVVQLWPFGPALLNQHLFRVLPSAPGTGVDYLLHALGDRLPEFRARAQGTTMRHIKRAALTEVTVGVPSGDLLVRFTDVVRPVHDLARNLVTQNVNLRATRDLLLPRLVSGEIDVSGLDIDTDWLVA